MLKGKEGTEGERQSPPARSESQAFEGEMPHLMQSANEMTTRVWSISFFFDNSLPRCRRKLSTILMMCGMIRLQLPST